MRVWVDLTNTAHVLVLRPLVELLERRGHEVTVTARPLSHTVELLEQWGHPHTVIGRHGGAGGAGKARAAAVRLRPGAWLDGAAAGLPRPRHTQHDDVRLRVGGASAPCELPPRIPGAGSRGDSARAACPLRRKASEARPVPGTEGGVLPLGV